MSALALCLALGRPALELWILVACGLLLVPLEERSRATTTFWRGAFRDAELRREFLEHVRSPGVR